MEASELSIIPDLLSRAENILTGLQPEEGGWWRGKHHWRLQTDISGDYTFKMMYNVCIYNVRMFWKVKLSICKIKDLKFPRQGAIK